jgi:Man1-Src1p-C-terminal domain
MCDYYVVSTRYKRESEEEEVLLMVKKIIVRLAHHHASKMADRRPQDAFMAITHVRDSIIPLEDRESKSKLWKKAVQYLENNESRIRAEMQHIEGEDHRVWRWLAPSMTHGNQGLVSGASADHSVDETCPRVWSVGPALGKYPAPLSVYPMA